jgi:hypothetical protein
VSTKHDDRQPFDIERWQKRCDDLMKAVRENSADAVMLCIVTLDRDNNEALVAGDGEGFNSALDAGCRYFNAKYAADGDANDIEPIYASDVN